VQIGTVSESGDPHTRTVVFRGFDNTNLIFASDERGGLCRDIRHRPRVQVCWYCTCPVDLARH